MSHIKIKFNIEEVSGKKYLYYDLECSEEFCNFYNNDRFIIEDNCVKRVLYDGQVNNRFRVCVGGSYDPSNLTIGDGSRFTIRNKSNQKLLITKEDKVNDYIKNVLICLKILSENVGKH